MDPQALGRYLRQNREIKEITLDDAVRDLRIRKTTLQAFEMGEFKSAGSDVQVRGLLRNYARYLGLDEDRVIGLYHDALLSKKGRRRKKRHDKKRDTSEIAARRKVTDTQPILPQPTTLAEQRSAQQARRQGMMRFVMMAVVAVAAFAVIVYVSVDLLTGEPVEPDAPTQPGSVALQATSTPLPITTATSTPTLDPLGDFVGTGVTVAVDFTQRAWVRITVDGNLQYAGLVEAGDFWEASNATLIEMTSSNAAALDVRFNGREQDSFGERGQRVDLAFGLGGINVQSGPSAAASPTPQPVIAASNTPLPIPTTLPTLQPTMATFEPVLNTGPSPTPLFPVGGAQSQPPTQSNDAVFDAPAIPSITPQPDTAASSPTAAPTRANATPTAMLPVRVTSTSIVPTKPLE